MDNARVVGNKFDIAGMTIPMEPYKYGLYIEYSTGYTIEENYFEEKKSGIGSIGLYISNSGPKPNEVYKNDFKGLDYGIVAYGKNRSEEGAGLCLKCNNFETCDNDIQVIPEKDEHGNWIPGREEGIASMQGTGGSDTAPAGNTFTDIEALPTTFNYFNHQDCNLIDYFHHDDYPEDLIIEPDPYSIDMINKVEASGTNYQDLDHACPSHIGLGNINLTLEKSLIISENEQVFIYSDSIQELKDGGDTYSLNLDVYTSTTEDAYEIRQQLLDESPYLSDTVMKSAILKENVFPNAMIRDVLVANPQSAKSSEILVEVNERMSPMPDEMLEEILEGRTYKGNLEILQDKLAYHQTEKFVSLRKLESYYKQDTLDFQGSQDSLINLWECETDPSTKYKLAFLYLYKGDSSNCFSTLNSIPQLNELSPDEVVGFEEYSEFLSLLWPLRNGKMTMDSLTTGQLFDLAGSRSVPGSLARNILVAAGLTEYQEPIYLADELKSSWALPEKRNNKFINDKRLKVFPNPAKDYIIVSYNLVNFNGDFQIKIISSEGKPVYHERITGVENEMLISTVQFPSTQYNLYLIDGYRIIESIHFVIIK